MNFESLNDMETKKYLIFDLDGTILNTPKGADYHLAKPDENMIKLINYLYDKGYRIVIETGRGVLHNENFVKLTRMQLKRWNIKYHILDFVRKPCNYQRVDDDSCSPEEFINQFLQGDI